MKNRGKVIPSVLFVILTLLIFIGSFNAFSGDITKNGMSQGDIFTYFENIRDFCNEVKSDVNANSVLNTTMNFSYGGIAINAVNGVYFTTANAIDFSISNVFYQKAAIITGEFESGLTVLAADQRCKFLITLNSIGGISTEQGTIVASTETATLPALPTGVCPIAYIEVSTATAVFTPGTTSLGASDVTDTYVNLRKVNSGSSVDPANTVSATDLTLKGL